MTSLFPDYIVYQLLEWAVCKLYMPTLHRMALMIITLFIFESRMYFLLSSKKILHTFFIKTF